MSGPCRTLLGLLSERLASALPENNMDCSNWLSFEQLALLLHSLRCCCLASNEVKQLLHVAWSHTQLWDTKNIRTKNIRTQK